MDEQLTNPEFLVHADPERVPALLALASGPAARLAAAVYRASGRAHRGADAATRRQILAVDAARFGDRALSDLIAAVEVPGVPAARWRVDWATGSRVHPGFCGFLEGGWPPPVVAVDGRPTTVTRAEGVVVFRDQATGEVACRVPVASSVRGEEETTAVVDGRAVTVSCAGQGGPKLLDPATGELLCVLPTGDRSKSNLNYLFHVESVVIDGRPHVIAGNEHRVVVWDLTSRELVADLESDGDDLQSWAVVTLDGRPHVVTGSFAGKVDVWDIATSKQVGTVQADDSELGLMVAATIGGRPHVLTVGCNEYVREPLDTIDVWSIEPLRQVDRLPWSYSSVEVEEVETAALGDRCFVVADGDRMWELSPAEPVGNRTPGHAAVVTAVATTVLDGRPVAVTGSYDETLRVWDLATGLPTGPPMSAEPHKEWDGVVTVRTALVDGRPYAVTEHISGHNVTTVRVWDLTTREELTDDDRPAEITTSMTDGNGLAPAAMSLPADGRTYAAFATGTVDGRPVAVVADGDRVRVWDSTGNPATVTDELVFPHCVHTVAVGPEGRLLVGFGDDIAVLSRR